MTKWSYVEHPLIGLGDNEQWYLIGSPERPIGYVRNEKDAKLIVHAPEMCEMLVELVSSGNLFVSDEDRVIELLMEIGVEGLKHE